MYSCKPICKDIDLIWVSMISTTILFHSFSITSHHELKEWVEYNCREKYIHNDRLCPRQEVRMQDNPQKVEHDQIQLHPPNHIFSTRKAEARQEPIQCRAGWAYEPCRYLNMGNGRPNEAKSSQNSIVRQHMWRAQCSFNLDRWGITFLHFLCVDYPVFVTRCRFAESKYSPIEKLRKIILLSPFLPSMKNRHVTRPARSNPTDCGHNSQR